MKQIILNNENARLKEVNAYSCLDSYYYEKLELLVKTAAAFFEVPVVYISMIEEFNQVIKVKKGISNSILGRNGAFCHRIITKGTTVIFKKILQDISDKYNPQTEHIADMEFQAGAPLVSKNGYVLGAFCICDTIAREFDKKDEAKLTTISNMAACLFELNLISLKSQRPLASESRLYTEMKLIKKEHEETLNRIKQHTKNNDSADVA